MYSWNFRILQTINEYQKSTQQGKLVRIANFLKLEEKCSKDISYCSQIVFFQSLHYTCFSIAIKCPLQVPGFNPKQAGLFADSYGRGGGGGGRGVRADSASLFNFC